MARILPYVPRAAPVRIAAPADAVRNAAVSHLGAHVLDDGRLHVPLANAPTAGVGVAVTLRPDGDVTLVAAERVGHLQIPFFAWAFRPLVAVAAKRTRAYALAVLRHDLEGGPAPPGPRAVIGLPDVAFSPAQATLLATAAAAVAVVAFASALFGQLADPIADSFDTSDATLGVALAVTRVGALVALFATALADRQGRRRSILIGVVGSAAAAAVSAVGPNLAVFTTAQVFQRAFVITTVTVAGVAVIEEAPEGARAYSASMLALAGGFGFSFAVVTLPLADLGIEAWRLPYALAALTVLLAPAIARQLAETTRYAAIRDRTDIARGRVAELFDRRYGRRFVLLGAAALLTSVFNAPSSQFMNKYLSDERGFSNTGIAAFRAVTTAVPGLVGLLIGGRLAERYGRKPVASVALLVATVTQMVFFLHGGGVLWVTSAASVLTASAAGVALGTLDAELFPTEVRGTSNALLTVVAVVGSALGLVAAGALSDPLDGIGRGIALLGLASIVAALVVVPRLPETSARLLDDVSPSEPRRERPEPRPDRGEYRPRDG